MFCCIKTTRVGGDELSTWVCLVGGGEGGVNDICFDPAFLHFVLTAFFAQRLATPHGMHEQLKLLLN